MTGGTFTISNGGVFGSMLSTPIINPPQSGILGMHNIVERPVVKDGAIVVAPVMYVALSYDHRIIDGRESVGFLVAVKEGIENPLEHLMDGDLKRALELSSARASIHQAYVNRNPIVAWITGPQQGSNSLKAAHPAHSVVGWDQKGHLPQTASAA